jgi:hypothetical protein
MEAPDTSDIDLDPAHFRCPADLWYRLQQLWKKIGRPSYEELSELTGVRRATLYDLLGENSKTRNNQNRPLWDTVRRFVLGCGVSETKLEAWEAAWKASVAQDMPTWPEEQQQLLTKIDQLTTDLAAEKTRAEQLATELAEAKAHIDQITMDLAEAEARNGKNTAALAEAMARAVQCAAAVEAAEARATNAEAALAAYHHVPSLPAPIEQLHIRAQTYYDAQDYAGAIKLYGQIATEIERKYGPGHACTLQAQRRHLEVKTEASQKKRGSDWYNFWFPLFVRHKLNARWKRLICAHQRHLPEGNRTTLELRLDHIYWVAILLNCDYYKKLSPARKLLIALHADCKLFLSPDDPFTTQVAEYMKTEKDWNFKRPIRQQWSPKPEPQRQKRRSVSDVFQYGDAERSN